jgi:hypothetical protein
MASAKLTALTELSVLDVADLVYSVDVSDTTDDAAGSSRKLTVQRLLGLLQLFQGRLTTESGVPVSSSDRTAQGTIYLTPFNGNALALYDGTRWKLYRFSEVSLALSSLTSGKNYDVFVYDNAGTLTIELSAAWTNDTTRADALATQDGVLVKSGATTRRYVGTIRTTGTATTEDSGGGSTTQVGGKRFVWNYYNRVPRTLRVKDTTDNWSYNTGAWRQANGASGNQVEYVVGDASVEVKAHNVGTTYLISAGLSSIAVGVDSTTVPSGHQSFAFNDAGNEIIWTQVADYAGQPGLGYHYLAMLETGGGGGGSSFFGDDGGDRQSGMYAEIMG